MLSNFKSKIIPIFSQAQKVFKAYEAKSTQNLLKQNRMMARTYLDSKSLYCFSTFFDKLDNTDVQTYSSRKYQNKKYRGLIDLWKKPLEKKVKRQQRIKQIKQALPQPVIEGEKLVVHNEAVGIQYPPSKNQIFCVVKVDGFQYKVTQDCLLILDTKEDHQINKTIRFQQVLLAGTTSYTVLGRPFLDNTYAQGIIESISDSEKTLVFKKKRRKQYKKSFGSKVKLTSCRITKIFHQLKQQTLQRAVSLVSTPKQQKLRISQ